MVKKSLLFFLPVSLSFAQPAALANCDCPSLQDIAGEYITTEIARYRGGLTSPEQAERRIGVSTRVTEHAFSLWNEVYYEAPSYEVVCHSQRQEEGEVAAPSERWGYFYGFGVDRNTIVTLDIVPSEQDGARLSFEFVDDELWAFIDGWFYRLEREPKVEDDET
ncbi:MAG: hypothetical protein JJU25_02465 [Halomonas sp.]|nr:hypothetical protein [Halomonas sp.]MCC5881489.1 hypothetical protein [Halomonas sp.]